MARRHDTAGMTGTTAIIAAATLVAVIAGVVVLVVTDHAGSIPLLLGSLPAVLALFRIEAVKATSESNGHQITEVRSLVNGHTERIIDSTRQMAKEAVREAAMVAVREAIKLPPSQHEDAPAAAGVTAERVVNERLTPAAEAVKEAHRDKAGTPERPKRVRKATKK